MFAYGGDHPVPDGNGGIVRPGDLRDKPDPTFGPWNEVPSAGPGSPQEAPAAASAPAPPPAPAGPAKPATGPAAGSEGK